MTDTPLSAELHQEALSLVKDAMRQGRSTIRLKRRGGEDAVCPQYSVWAEDYLGPHNSGKKAERTLEGKSAARIRCSSDPPGKSA